MLGLTRRFSPGSTEKKVPISQVWQKTVIDVNQDGAFPDSTTSMFDYAGHPRFVFNGWRKAGFPFVLPDPIKFTCNRPFTYALKDNLSGTVLLNGRVMNAPDAQ